MISENQPCPCGSGKKYKRCCGMDGQTKLTNENYLKKFNTVDLIQNFSALTLVAENHGKNLRLEEVTKESVAKLNENERQIPYDELRAYLSSNYPFDAREDPPGNLFTELVAFYGGDYLIMPGINESPAFTLNNLLQAIFNWPNVDQNPYFKSNVSYATNLILAISDRMLKKAGFKRYMYAKREGRLISFPSSNRFRQLKNAVFFSKAELDELLSDHDIVKEALDEFTIKLNDPRFKDEEIEDSLFLRFPIIEDSGGILVVSPTSLVYALVEAIKEMADQFHCTEQVHKAYHELIWNSCKSDLQILGFIPIEIPEVQTNDQYSEFTLFSKFDDEKVAVIQYWPASRPGVGPSLEDLQKSRHNSIGAIHAIPKYKDFQLLDILVSGLMMNELMIPINGSTQSRSMVLLAPDLDILVKSGKASALKLWNYVQARDEQIPRTFKMTLLTFLDQFEIYQEHSESFYLSDEGFDISKWQYGSAQEFIEQAKQRRDEHSVTLLHDGKIQNILVIRRDRYAPIYYSTMGLRAQDLQFAVEGYGITVWVKALKENHLSHPLRHIYWEMTDCIAYWLWQICDDIKALFEDLEPKYINFEFRLDEPVAFEKLDEPFYRDPGVSSFMKVKAEPNAIELTIPKQLMTYFYGEDNEGDRILVKQLLEGVNIWLTQGGKQVLTASQINEIVERRAPLGAKKKLVILHTRSNLLLDKRNLSNPIYIGDFYTSSLANRSAELLGDRCPPVGEIVNEQERRRLPKNLVIHGLLPLLKKTIDQYNNQQLIERLLSLNESLINEREHQKISIPTRIACFVDVEQQIEDSVDKMSDISRASTATRCLLEHIAAEPAKGNRMVSTETIQELLAIMDAIISWGSLGDQLTFHLFDIRLGILPTGRIGTQKVIANNVFDPYYHEKAKEHVADAISTFKQEFPTDEDEPTGGEIPSFLDKAFLEEFKISLFKIFNFLDLLAGIGFQEDTAFAKIKKRVLFEKILHHNPGINNEEFDAALTFLALWDRGKVENVPSGFEHYDISPWRFNRRLSLLRKPVIIVENSDLEDSYLYWGPRQALLSKRTLAEQCWTDRLKVPDSSPLKRAMGKLANSRGTGLVRSVLEELKIPDSIIDSEVFIAPNGKFKNPTDIGDIDVLLIDIKDRVLYSLECKSFAPSRNIKEMIEECDKLLGSKKEKGLIQRHVEREEWIRGNLDKMGSHYEVDLTEFKLVSAFVTREGMLFPHLTEVGVTMPFVSFYDLEKDGVEALRRI